MNTPFPIRLVASSLLLIFCGMAYSQSVERRPVRDIERIISIYRGSLENQNAGVVEATIFHLITVRTLFPEQDYRKVSKELSRLALAGVTPSIRFKSFVAVNYIQYPQLFEGIDDEIREAKIDQADQVFERLESRLSSYQVSSAGI
ncbi:MAG TPA: hypothetical protein VGA99_15820 [bacterium]